MEILKQKAIELTKAFYDPANDFPDEQARENAQICVDEIIKELKLVYNGSYPTYWDHVKVEISNLTWREITKK